MNIDLYLFEDQVVPAQTIRTTVANWNAANPLSCFSFCLTSYQLTNEGEHSAALVDIAKWKGKLGIAVDMHMEALGNDLPAVNKFRELGIDQAVAQNCLWGLKIIEAFKANESIDAVIMIASSWVVKDHFLTIARVLGRPGIYFRHTGGSLSGKDDSPDDQQRVSERTNELIQHLVAVFGNPYQRASPPRTKDWF